MLGSGRPPLAPRYLLETAPAATTWRQATVPIPCDTELTGHAQLTRRRAAASRAREAPRPRASWPGCRPARALEHARRPRHARAPTHPWRPPRRRLPLAPAASAASPRPFASAASPPPSRKASSASTVLLALQRAPVRGPHGRVDNRRQRRGERRLRELGPRGGGTGGSGIAHLCCACSAAACVCCIWRRTTLACISVRCWGHASSLRRTCLALGVAVALGVGSVRGCGSVRGSGSVRVAVGVGVGPGR